MVLFVMRWNTISDKKEAYTEWTQGAIGRTLAAPGVVEFRAYRPVTGSSRHVITYEFADLAAWATWYAHQNVRDVLEELNLLVSDISTDLWGPSPVVPAPIRPGG